MKCLRTVGALCWILLSCTEQPVKSEDELVEGRALTAADYLSVRMLPDKAEVPAGRRLPLTVVGILPYDRDAELTQLGTFESSDPEVFDFSQDEPGLGLALKTGTATLTFTYEQLSATAEITVAEKVLDQLHLAPESLDVAIEKIGSTYEERHITMLATGIHSDGSSQDMTDQVQWTLSSEESLTMLSDHPGVLVTKAPGRTQVTATLGDKVQTRTIDVVQGRTELKQFSISPTPLVFPLQTARDIEVTAHYTDGTTVPITEDATYSLDPANLATLSPNGNGALTVTSQTTGNGTLTVSYRDISQNFDLAAVDAEASLLRLVSARNFSLAKGEVESFEVWLDASDGTQENVTTRATWSVSNTSVLTAVVGSRGRYTAIRAGTSTISARLGSLTVTQTVQVSPAAVSSLVLTASASGTLGLYQTRDYVATATYTDATVQVVTNDVTWSFLADTGAGTFDATVKSRFQGTGSGTGTIRATLGSVFAETSLVIGPVVPVTLNLQASWSSLSLAGGSNTLTAYVVYSDGSSLDVTADTEWNYQIVGSGLSFAGYVSNETGSKGVCVPLATGLFKAKANYQGLNGEKSIQVVP
ncbi:hypothetical protein [Oligoflexus tunisiensis]|uniref:hypothetical protein n=1 Tax=Oligoflexus tunisiensis TaxID=708132 RepID=UPI00114D1AE9|nr:hypothetical protein [Oligoflexus tunisiensis]